MTDTSTTINEKVMAVPKNVPQSFEFPGDKFYVRDCYEAYYQQIMGLLGRYKYISVTGTPGIGKSMFYLYFFTRYRSDNPEKSLVTASFSKDRVLQDCVLFRPNKDDEVRTGIPARKTVLWPEDMDCDLFLYDGPPGIAPRHVKMITFTSPSFGWLNSMVKDARHKRVYMPVCPCEELLDANDVLELGIPDEELEQRFLQFGGSARYCLAGDPSYVELGQHEIAEALSKVSGSQQLYDCFTGPVDNALIVHRLMHYLPGVGGLYQRHQVMWDLAVSCGMPSQVIVGGITSHGSL
jgi:hypothetical protein